MPLLLLLTSKALPSMPGRPVDSLSLTHTSTYSLSLSLSLSLSHTHTHTHTHTRHAHKHCVSGGGGSKTKTAGGTTQWQRGWLANLNHVVKRTNLHN
jgi:hypothetical protein